MKKVDQTKRVYLAKLTDDRMDSMQYMGQISDRFGVYKDLANSTKNYQWYHMIDMHKRKVAVDLPLPDGSEIPGLTEETDQLVVSVNAPRAEVEEEPEIEEGDALEADGDSASDDSADEGSSEEQENSEETSE